MPPFRGFGAQGEEGVCEGRHIIPDVDAVVGRLHDRQVRGRVTWFGLGRLISPKRTLVGQGGWRVPVSKCGKQERGDRGRTTSGKEGLPG